MLKIPRSMLGLAARGLRVGAMQHLFYLLAKQLLVLYFKAAMLVRMAEVGAAASMEGVAVPLMVEEEVYLVFFVHRRTL